MISRERIADVAGLSVDEADTVNGSIQISLTKGEAFSLRNIANAESRDFKEQLIFILRAVICGDKDALYRIVCVADSLAKHTTERHSWE